jgi:hypothetical protein
MVNHAMISTLSILALGAASCSSGSGQGATGGTVGTGGQAGGGATGAGGSGPGGAGGQECGNPDGGVVVDYGTPPPNAVVTAVGVPSMPPSSAVIGPAGGTVTSADQYLQITIPAGALCADTTIGITNITNMAPGGLGSAYRLTPDGQMFAVPVTLRFRPGDELLTDPLEVTLAFQRVGVWQVQPQTYVSDPNDPMYDPNVVTYRATTTHFADYAYAELMFVAGPSQVVVGQSVNLEVTEYDLALAGPVYLAGTTHSYPSLSYLTGWSVPGMQWGTLDTTSPYGYVISSNDGYGPDAVYTAPAQLPSSGNPVTITAMVPSGSTDYWIHKRIQLLPAQ